VGKKEGSCISNVLFDRHENSKFCCKKQQTIFIHRKDLKGGNPNEMKIVYLFIKKTAVNKLNGLVHEERNQIEEPSWNKMQPKQKSDVLIRY